MHRSNLASRTRLITLGLAGALLSLACGGFGQSEPEEVSAETARAAMEAVEAARAEGLATEAAPATSKEPAVFELLEADGQCSWRKHSTGESELLLSHPAPCPSTYALGVSEGGVPRVGVVGGGVLVAQEDGKTDTLPAPPDGRLERAALEKGAVVAATLLEIQGPGPFDYAGETWSWERQDGIYALAIRWGWDGSQWQRQEIATTTTGWDLALEIDALDGRLPLFEQPGEELRAIARELDPSVVVQYELREELDRLAADLGPSQREGWFVADTAHGRIAAGWFTGEFIHTTGPIFVEVDGGWKHVEFEGAGEINVRTRVDGDRMLLQIHGGTGMIVHLKTGEAVVQSEGTLMLLPRTP